MKRAEKEKGRLEVVWGWECGLIANRYKGLFWVTEVFSNWIVVMIAQLCKFTKNN